jgi:hypothetical protein
MAHTPLKMAIDEAHAEVRIGWANSYSAKAIEGAVDSLNHEPLGYRTNILILRPCFRGIYFPQMGRLAWVRTIFENRRTIFKLIRQGLRARLHAAAPSVAFSPSQAINPGVTSLCLRLIVSAGWRLRSRRHFVLRFSSPIPSPT